MAFHIVEDCERIESLSRYIEVVIQAKGSYIKY